MAQREPRQLRYRAEVRGRVGAGGGGLHLYDGGEFSPYGIESLLDLLRSEARTTTHALEMTFEILGACSAPRLEEVAGRFSRASIPGLSVTVRAAGLPSLRVGAAEAVNSPSNTPPSRSGRP